MGGINLGDLFASLHLDHEQYLRAIEASRGAHKSLNDALLASDAELKKFMSEMNAVGVSTEKLNLLLDQLVKKNTAVAGSFQTTAGAVGAAQKQLLSLAGSINMVSVSQGNLTMQWAQSFKTVKEQIASIDIGNQGKLAAAEFAKLENIERTHTEQKLIRDKMETDSDKLRTSVLIGDLKAQEAAYIRMEEAQAVSSGGIGGRFGVRVNGGGISPHGWINSPVAIGGAAAGFLTYESVKKAIEFEDALTKVDVLMDGVSKNMRDKMGSAAKELAVETGESAAKIVAQFGTMHKAGVETGDMFKVLPEITKLAVGTGNDLHDTFKQVLTVVDAMRVPISKVGDLTDMLARANQMARGSVEQFAEALEGKAAGALRQANIPMSQALGLIVAMSQRGVEANVAQTALTQVITKLGTSAEKYGKVILDVGGQQIKWNDVVKDSNNNMRPMVDILSTMDKAFVGRSTGEINKFLQVIGLGGQRDVYLKSLLGISDALRGINAEFENTAGQGIATFDKAMQAPSNQLKQLEQTWHNLEINVGELFLPTILKLVTPLASVVELLAKGATAMGNFLSYLPGVKLMGYAMDTLSTAWKWAIEHMPGSSGQGPATGRPATASRTPAEIQEEGRRMTLEHSLAGSGNPLFDDPAADEKLRKKNQALAIALDSAKALYSRFYEEVSHDSERFATADTSFAQKAIADIDALFRSGADPAKIKSVLATSFEALHEFEHKMEQEQRDTQNRALLFVEYWKSMDKQAKENEAASLLSMKIQELPPPQHKEIGQVGAKAAFGTQNVAGFAEMRDLNDLMTAYKHLGMEIEVGPDEAMRLLLVNFHKVVDSAKQIDTVRTAWAAVDGAITKLSKISLPEAIKEYEYLERKLKERGATEGEVMNITEKRLKVQIETAAQDGKDATKLINNLTLIEMRQKIMRDTSTAIGETGKSIYMQLNSGFEVLFTSIGKNIFAMKSLKEVALNFLNSLASNIFGQVFGLFGKFLGNSIFGGLGSIFKGAGGAAGGFYGSGLTAYAAGSWDTGPNTHLSVIHPHEMVLNESVATTVRSGGFGGGGGDTHVHVDFSGSTFSGVTQTLVDSVMNKAIKSARLSGSKFGPVG